MRNSKIIVRYAETDQMGIAHHSIYPVWYEVARTDFAKNMGMAYSQMEKMGILTPLVELSSKYIRPAKYEDELEIKVIVGKLTPARIEFIYEVYKKGEESPINIGKTVHAWVGKDLRPINMRQCNPKLYERIEKYQKSF